MHPTLSARTEQLLRTLAERNSVTVDDILRERDSRSAGNARARLQQRTREELVAGQLEISERCAAHPVLDPRSPDEILSYMLSPRA